MKTLRMLAAFAVLVLLLALVPGALAQEETFGLSPEDAAVYATANANSTAAKSGQFNFVMNLTITSEGETGQISLTGNGSFDEDAAGNPLFQLSLSGQADFGDEMGPMPLNVDVRFVNESIYFMAPMLLGPQWLQITPEELSELASDFGEEMPMDPLALMEGDLSSLEGMEEWGDALMALATLQPERYIAMTRSGDQFTTTIDITGLVADPALQSFFRMLILQNAADMGDDSVDEAEVNQVLAALPTALQGTALTLDQYVVDNFIGRTVLTFAANFDPAVIGEEGEAFNLGLTFDLTVSGFNGSYPVEAPADSMPLSEMFAAMMGGMMEN